MADTSNYTNYTQTYTYKYKYTLKNTNKNLQLDYNFKFQMADTSKGRHTLGRAAQDISHFLGYVLCLHGLGM